MSLKYATFVVLLFLAIIAGVITLAIMFNPVLIFLLLCGGVFGSFVLSILIVSTLGDLPETLSKVWKALFR